MGIPIGTKIRKFWSEATMAQAARYVELLTGHDGSSFWYFDRGVLSGSNSGLLNGQELLDLCQSRIAAGGATNSTAVNWKIEGRHSEQTWMLKLVFSRIPHAELKLIDYLRNSEPVDTQLPEREAVEAINLGLGDVVQNRDRFFAKKAHLYLDLKIRQSRNLSEIFNKSRSNASSAILELMGVLSDPLIFPDFQQVEAFNHKESKVKSFLHDCDQAIIEKVGTARLTDLLQPLDVTLKKWLAIK
jgi:hypothetical protein